MVEAAGEDGAGGARDSFPSIADFSFGAGVTAAAGGAGAVGPSSTAAFGTGFSGTGPGGFKEYGEKK